MAMEAVNFQDATLGRFGGTIAASTTSMISGRVLVVDDDDNLRRGLQIELEHEGYETRSVASAEEALPLLERSPHHLVITDLNLPGVSGIDLLKRIRLEYFETDVIVMAAFATVRTALDAMKAGAYDYITKPIHVGELKALTKRSIERRSRA